MHISRQALALVTAAALSVLPAVAFGHGAVTDTHDTGSGSGLLWLYGIVLGAVAGLILYRIYLRASGRQDGAENRGHVADLERTLASHQTALRNAEDYPNEYGLSRDERQSRVDAIATLRRLIDEEKLKRSSATADAQSIET